MHLLRNPEATATFLNSWTHNIVLHNPSPALDATATCNFLHALAARIGERPEHYEVLLGEKWYRPPIRRGNRQIREGKFDAYELMGLMNYAFKGERADTTFPIHIGRSSRVGRLAFHYRKELGDLELARELMVEACNSYGFSLGYYWTMQRKHHPQHFGGSVINAGTPLRLQRQQSNFVEGLRKGIHEAGHFRDVFRLNVLSDRHLASMVQRLSFSDWVHETSAQRAQDGPSTLTRGTLTKISQSNWLWEVHRDEAPTLREALVKEDVVLSELDLDKIHALMRLH